MKKVLEIKDLSFEVFGVERKILDDINWSVKKGEHWAMLGANGAGKTSLLSTVCAYNTPSDGTMTVDGKCYSEYDWQKVRERIAIVSAQLNRRIEAHENVFDAVIGGAYAMLNFWGTPSDSVRRRALQKMKELGITYLRDSVWGTISQGERQKVLIARALMIKPAIMFLDEPCGGLDPVARENFIAFINDIAKSANCPPIVLATHHVEEIPPTFTHAIILKNGKVLASGAISDVVTSEILSEAYGAKCVLGRRDSKYTLKIT